MLRRPLALVSLLFATVVFSEPTSPNDPFRAIVLRKPRQPGPPICCLRAPPPLESVDDQVLLSFEDWKAKQTQMRADAASPETGEKASDRSGHELEGANSRYRGDGKEGSNVTDDLGSLMQKDSDLNGAQTAETLSPHFRVPITDRFNYASLDCSARVHTAHRGARSASAILISKKDRYMLSPCNTPNIQQFVVVELCEDIRIDTVQLANFEFFSGVFKDFSVSVAKTYNGPWADAGTYRAKNIRGVQSFHTPATLRDFYRYIRIDFHSHYGNEYYCPLSLLRVYGLTHLEEWKWELWEAESKAKQAEFDRVATLVLPASEIDPDKFSANTSTPTEQGQPIIPGPFEEAPENVTSASVDSRPAFIPNDTPSIPNEFYENDTTSRIQVIYSSTAYASPSTTGFTSTIPVPRASAPSSSSVANSSASLPSTSVLSYNAAPPRPSGADPHFNTTVANPGTRSTSQSITSGSPPAVVNPHVSPSSPSLPVTTGGESIYRTIMNRLGAIETNHTLYARYIEQQNGAIRDVIKRLGEDVGRLEAITRAQRMAHQKSAGQWEKERMQMIRDYNQLRSRVDYLSEEIVLEKRLGVIQLCLLFAVLIFVGLTRGSRGESIVVTGPGSVREWGKRHLSLSGDWNRFMRKRSSRSPVRAKPQVPAAVSPSKVTTKLAGDRLNFPKSDEPSWSKAPFEQIQMNTALLPSEQRARKKKNSQTRSRTPSLRTPSKCTPQMVNPQQRSGALTPIRVAHLRPQLLQRSSSQGAHSSLYAGNFVPKSTKKWARTAHIHPLKSPMLAPSAIQTQTGKDDDHDVFSSPFGQEQGHPMLHIAASDKREEEEGESGLMSTLQIFNFSGDDRDTESNWADTDSVVGSDLDGQIE